MSRISSLGAQTQPDSQNAPGRSDKVERILERITDEKDRSEKNRELFKVAWLHFANELYALLGDQDDESGQTFKEISDTFVFLEQAFAILRPQDGEVKFKGKLEDLKKIAKLALIRKKEIVVEHLKAAWLYHANELYALLGDQVDESGQTFKEIPDTFEFLKQLFSILRPQDGEIKFEGTLEELKEIAKVARIRNKPRVIEAVKEQLDSLREF